MVCSANSASTAPCAVFSPHFLLHTSKRHRFSSPQQLLCAFPTRPKLAVSLQASTSSSSSSSSTPVFLPLLQREQQKLQCEEKSQQEEDKKQQDPFVKFFKSRTLTRDPPREGKFTLQQNRRKTSWHLAQHDFTFVEDEHEEEANFQMGSEISAQNSSLQSPLPEGICGEILQISRTLQENVTLGECLGDFEGRVGKGECVEVLRLLGSEGLVMCCLWFFEWMGLQEPSLVSPRACGVVFTVLGEVGMGDRLMVLFENLPGGKEFRDVYVYNAAISGLMRCNRYDDAWKVYETMEAKNVPPDQVTCSIVITLMRKMGRSAKDAWEFFERMNRKGVEWSLEVLGALVKSFCNEGLKSEALVIQLEMEKKGISSNAVVYNTIMDAYVKSNQVEEAEGLFAEMKARDIMPITATFNILMNAYSRRMQPEIVEKLLLEMEGMGLKPNAKSYTCLISAYGRQKKMSDMAADAFLRMRKFGIKPTTHSYTALIHAYSISEWHEKAYIAFENMRKEGLKPSIETYTALLDAFRRAGDSETLMKIWKLMIKEKIEGTQVTFNTLVDGFAKQGQYVEARDVIAEFKKIGLQPTVMTYNMLMNAYARGGQHSKLPELLKEMVARNLNPDCYTYSTMIYAYIRVRDYKRAFYYHKMMVKSGQVPDVKTYEKLRALLDVKAAIKNKKDKSAILGIVNSKMGLLKAKKKGKKDEFWKTKKKHLKNRNADSH